jgi:hypothetical protein
LVHHPHPGDNQDLQRTLHFDSREVMKNRGKRLAVQVAFL